MQVTDRHIADETNRQALIEQAALELQRQQIANQDAWADESQQSYGEIQHQRQLPQQGQRSAAIVQRRQPQIEQYSQPIQYVPMGSQSRDWTPLYVLAGLVGVICVAGAVMVSAAANTANQPNQSIQQLAAANAALADAAAAPRINCGWISLNCGQPTQQAAAAAPIQQAGPVAAYVQSQQVTATPEQIQQWVNTLSQYDPAVVAVPTRGQCNDNPGLKEAYEQFTGRKDACLAL
jgi:hypothetical protein